MNIQSRKAALGLAIVGLLSYPACTAEKTAMKDRELSVAPKVVDGVFASCDQLQPVYFELNQSKLSDAAMEIAKTNAEWLKNQPPFLVRIVGYADSRGSTKKNDRLAERRALAVRDAYVALGLSKDRFSLASRGAETPLCTPTTEDCLSKSRRSETLIEDKSLASS